MGKWLTPPQAKELPTFTSTLETIEAMRAIYNIMVLVVCFSFVCAGCSSTQKRSTIVGAGAAAGAGAGYLVGRNAQGAAAGAIVGAAGTALAMGEDSDAYRRGVDDGYVQGSSDAVKRLYWSKQALEARDGAEPSGALRYYVWEEEGTTPDGRKLAPEKVAVPIYEPLPRK